MFTFGPAARGGAVDPLFGNVVFNLKLSGVNNATNGFSDNSNYGHVVTSVGGAKESNNYVVGGGSTSLSLDGVDDYLSIVDHAAFFLQQTGGEYTIEMWARIDSTFTGGACVYRNDGSGGWQYYTISVSPYMRLAQYVSAPVNGSDAIITNAWTHYAVSKRADGMTRFFTNGVYVGGETVVGGHQAAQGNPIPVRIGQASNGTGSMKANIDGVRITKGLTRYWASGFTPPTVPYPAG